MAPLCYDFRDRMSRKASALKGLGRPMLTRPQVMGEPVFSEASFRL
jgi:hypothetical protein